jgi:hypothetical protein
MSLRFFTDEQVNQLRKNPNVKHVSNKGMTYTDDFKEQFIIENEAGKLPREILEEAGFDIEVIGMDRVKSSAKRWREQNKRLEGLTDTRKDKSGRPRTKELTKDEIIERQRAEIEYLKQERAFLLELKRLERLAIQKEKSSGKTNTTSSRASSIKKKTD